MENGEGDVDSKELFETDEVPSVFLVLDLDVDEEVDVDLKEYKHDQGDEVLVQHND